ncbi:hypothetical protein EV424DRAFT_1539670 [Suillus variegatus]|nr:hypothetical protein EV424DRAFT_1539670 [Suillus variegatus]
MSTFMRMSPTQCSSVLYIVCPSLGSLCAAQCSSVFSVSYFMSLPRLDSVRGFLLNVLVFPLCLVSCLSRG